MRHIWKKTRRHDIKTWRWNERKIVQLKEFCTAKEQHDSLSVIWRKKVFKESDEIYISQNDAVELLNNRNLLTID